MGKWSNHSDRVGIALLVTCACLPLAGCAPKPVAVEGQVTLDGQPINEAAIMFVPLEQGRAKTGALIVDGRFALPVKEGLLPGRYRVEIVDNPPLDSIDHSHPAGAAQVQPKQRRQLPTVYTHNSPLRFEVRDGGTRAAPLAADFELKATASARGH